MKNLKYPIGNRIRGFPACSAVPLRTPRLRRGNILSLFHLEVHKLRKVSLSTQQTFSCFTNVSLVMTTADLWKFLLTFLFRADIFMGLSSEPRHV